MRWRIKGELRENGLRVEESLDADDAADALNKARFKGITVTEMIELAEDIPATPVLPYSGPATDEKKYPSKTSGLAQLYWVLVVLSILIILLFIGGAFGLFRVR